MAVGILSSRSRGAALLMIGQGTSVQPGAIGTLTELGAAAYDTLVYDSDGFAAGHGLADGKLRVTRNGIYRLRAWLEVIPPAASAEFVAYVGATMQATPPVGGPVPQFLDFVTTRPPMSAVVRKIDLVGETTVRMYFGWTINLNVRIVAGDVGVHNIYGAEFELLYLGRG